MNRKKDHDVVVFHEPDLPNMASPGNQVGYGYSLYRGILVRWDEDHDLRVLRFIDDLDPDIRIQLLVIQEHEGCLGMLWREHVPLGFSEDHEVDTADGDVWSIFSSASPKPE